MNVFFLQCSHDQLYNIKKIWKFCFNFQTYCFFGDKKQKGMNKQWKKKLRNKNGNIMSLIKCKSLVVYSCSLLSAFFVIVNFCIKKWLPIKARHVFFALLISQMMRFTVNIPLHKTLNFQKRKLKDLIFRYF